jgi:hypothetical protein
MARDQLDQLVTATDIGRMIGVGPDRVRQIAQRDDGFPAAVGRIGQATVWRWNEVEAWAWRADRSVAPPERRLFPSPRSSYARGVTGRLPKPPVR